MKKRYEEDGRSWDDLDEIILSERLTALPREVVNSIYSQTKQIMGRIVDYKEYRMIYACAIKEIKTKLEILNTEFSLQYYRNPINYIQTRMKSTASIVEKLATKNAPVNIDSMEENIHDIAGVRVVCSYIDDVFLISDALLKQDDITLISKKDYITTPKENGYRSLHLVVKVPVFFSERRIEVEVEIQIRTIAMDFWASLEHQLKYKNGVPGREELVDKLCKCAETINQIDTEMMGIRAKMEMTTNTPSEEEILLERIKKLDIPIE